MTSWLLAWLWWLWRWFYTVRWQPFLAELAIDDRFENASNTDGQVWRWLKANISGRFGGKRKSGDG